MNVPRQPIYYSKHNSLLWKMTSFKAPGEVHYRRDLTASPSKLVLSTPSCKMTKLAYPGPTAMMKQG